jgi:hypothetical protein
MEIDNSGNRVSVVNCADPVAVSGITKTLTTAGEDYTQELESGQMYIVTPVKVTVSLATVFAGVTDVTSTAANIEWVWCIGQSYIFRMPIGKTTLYLESDISATILYFRKLA